MRSHFYAPIRTLFPASIGLCLVGFVAQGDDPLAAVIVDRTYESADLGRIDLQGACNITPDVVSCWDPDGKPDADLAEKVKAYYIIQTGAEVRWKVGRKNRMVVFKEPSRVYGLGATINHAKTADGQYLQTAGQIDNYSQQHEPVLQWYGVDVDPNQSRTSVSFDISVRFGTAQLPIREGAEGRIGAINVRINSVKKGPDRKQTWGPNPNVSKKTWTVSISFTGNIAGRLPNPSLYVVDAKGNQIIKVDAGGNPRANPTSPIPNSVMPNTFGFDTGVYGIGTMKDGTQEFSVPVNPAKAGGLSISLNGSRMVTFKDILLDPK